MHSSSLALPTSASLEPALSLGAALGGVAHAHRGKAVGAAVALPPALGGLPRRLEGVRAALEWLRQLGWGRAAALLES